MITGISSATLRQMVRLSERKEALMAEIQKIDRAMLRLQEPESRAPAQVGQRGQLRAKVINALSAAGRNGLTIEALSKKTGAKPANLYVWFNANGKSTPGIKKIGRGKYRFVA
jgi:hypothetical protein